MFWNTLPNTKGHAPFSIEAATSQPEKSHSYRSTHLVAISPIPPLPRKRMPVNSGETGFWVRTETVPVNVVRFSPLEQPKNEQACPSSVSSPS